MIYRELMRVIKAVVKNVPQPVKHWMQRIPGLSSFYRRQLYRSGLHLAAIDPKTMQRLYMANIPHQQAIIDTFVLDVPKLPAIAVICGDDKTLLLNTLSSLVDAEAFCHIWLVSEDEQALTVLSQFPSIDATVVNSVADIVSQHVFFIIAGDKVHPDVAVVLSARDLSKQQLLYCDSDSYSGKRRCLAAFKPDWNPDLLISTGYVGSGLLVDLSYFQNLDGIALTEHWVNDALLLSYLTDINVSVAHIELVLVHRPLGHSDIDPFSAWGRKQLENIGRYECVISELNVWGFFPFHSAPRVSLIIPTRNAKALVEMSVESIWSKTRYRNFEILLVDNQSDDPEAIDYFVRLESEGKIRRLVYDEPFNYSAINNFAVNEARGEIIGLINNDIEVIDPDWLGNMVAHAMRDDIGCVGAKLLYPDDRVQHAGVVMGYGGGAGHAHKYFPKDHPGYLKRLAASNNYSAVTAACLLVRKSLFLNVDGLDDKNFTVAFNDVDFCLKIVSLGLRNLYCAEATLYHHESVSRGQDDTPVKRARFDSEVKKMQQKWQVFIDKDPAYNSNLTLHSENFSIKSHLSSGR